MFRNKEIRQFALILLLITAVFAAIGAAFHPAALWLSLASSACLCTAFLLFTKARYQSIARISDQIDLVLHHADRLYISEADEGELSILQSEITKMTQRIREQNHTLKAEKEHLADSLADIAHQLRTPLTSLTLVLSLLEKTSDKKEQKELFRETEELLVRMDWLITSLLKLSRLDAGVVIFKSEETEAVQLIHAALRPLAISMELHDITLHMQVPEGIQVCGDPGWLSEALQNILKNCIENIGDSGSIEILCRDTLLFTEITIHDSGAGFRKEDLPRLFDRFYRGKDSGAAGYGIGLALCKMIITRHGGTVTAKNHPQGGAVFLIRFPK